MKSNSSEGGPVVFSDPAYLRIALAQWAEGNNVEALALICAVGQGRSTSVLAFLMPQRPVRAPTFQHAIAMEIAYCDSLLSFETASPPCYGNAGTFTDFDQGIVRLGVDHLLCFITLDHAGVVRGIRHYDGLEVTLLEAVNRQLSLFMEMLNGDTAVLTSRMQ